MEEKKKTNEKEVAMVECPFCNKPIEAPAKADVIFKCPHCHKELITYEKNTIENNIEKKNTNNNLKNPKNMSLVYCKECGKQISSEAYNCPHCGCPQSNSTVDNNEISLGYLFISFLIPLIGIILCCVSWNKNDGKAKSAIIGTLAGLIMTIILYDIIF